jgi:integrase
LRDWPRLAFGGAEAGRLAGTVASRYQGHGQDGDRQRAARPHFFPKREPAERIKLPQNIKPTEKIPYTQTEVAKIVAPCDVVGNSSYEPLRARATVLLMRYTALRISDVVTLERDRVQNGQILLHTKKDGRGGVFADTRRTTAGAGRAAVSEGRNRTSTILPLQRQDVQVCAQVRVNHHMLHSVFTRAGVEGARAHRFRHTLATEILARSGTEPDCADILGQRELWSGSITRNGHQHASNGSRNCLRPFTLVHIWYRAKRHRN